MVHRFALMYVDWKQFLSPSWGCAFACGILGCDNHPAVGALRHTTTADCLTELNGQVVTDMARSTTAAHSVAPTATA
eukprot:COSAG06_NODE_43551_length_371_cov_0.577206_1_plen_76_part_01